MFVETFQVIANCVTTNIAIILTLVVITVYILRQRIRYDFWEKQGINGPKPLPLVGNNLDLLFKSVLIVNQERYKKYGRIFGFFDNAKPMLSVADPEVLRYIMAKDSDVLINRRPIQTSEPALYNMLTSLRDEKWKRMRSIMSPTFTSAKLKMMKVIMEKCVKSLLDHINEDVTENKDIELKEMYGAYTMDVIASCAFATKTNAHKNPSDPFVVNAKNFFSLSRFRLFAFVLIPTFVKLLINFNPQPATVINFFKQTTKEIIRQRRNKNVKFNDFMQLLLDAEMSNNLVSDMKDINAEQFTSEDHEDLAKQSKLLSTNHGSRKLSDDEIMAQSLIFFVAGFETTAALLTYTSYALALDSRVQNLLYNEIKQHFDTDEEITYENVNKMKYLNAVISESLRLYSPVLQLHRQASQEYKVPNTNITVPKGCVIQIPIYDIHHDEKNFPEPFTFKPERFLDENIDEIKPYTYLPFGSGPRNCIGMRFALMEAKLALCNILLQFKIVRSQNTDVPLKYYANPVATMPVKKVVVKMEKR